jgi:phosphohistidine swiveling domain-containing protein
MSPSALPSDDQSTTNPTSPYIVHLDEVGDEPVGGKAEGLAKLIRMGLPVPAGFVIVGARPGRLPEDLSDHYRQLSVNGQESRVAVRSSAIGEDSEGASFAGQYETVLDVKGKAELIAAVEGCLTSLESARARAYQAERGAEAGESADLAMSVVVQRMVEARKAGVLFTANPVSGRRGRSVIDAVEGLGESLVSGESSADHYDMDRAGSTVSMELVGEAPLLTDAERAALIHAALAAEAHEGIPLDLEWAIDRTGGIEWLQARPITHLPPDPNELDTPVLDDQHVYTRCNVGEMFPGVCTPLSYSFTAWSIDVGMQMMHRRIGIQSEIQPFFRFLAMGGGHLFLNLSTMSETATHALGSSADQLALSICGRPVDELEIRGSRPPPLPRRLLNGLRYIRYLFGRGHARAAMRQLVTELHFPERDTSAETWRVIDGRFAAIYAAMDHHLVSSACSGVLTTTLLSVLARGDTPLDAHHAEVARLLANTGDVESADIVAGAERIQAQIRKHPDGQARFALASAEDALGWLRSTHSGEAGREFERYLVRHGHRAIKELELRQAEWAADPTPLIKSIQAPLRHTFDAPGRSVAPATTRDTPPPYGLLMRRIISMARQAVRYREETKSGLVRVTTLFKRAYRRLAEQLVDEGRLPDLDAVFFLSHEELGQLVTGEAATLAERAVARRGAFAYQDAQIYPDVFKGAPEPLRPEAILALLDESNDGALSGAPVSRGRVSGRARVIRSLEEAEALEPGEILIAPITDVGWTPYFSLIAGLVTDIGSAVSHGAVVAREYGLPAVVNTRVATQVFKTGDQIVLDGDRGIVRLADAAKAKNPVSPPLRSPRPG